MHERTSARPPAASSWIGRRLVTVSASQETRLAARTSNQTTVMVGRCGHDNL